MSDERDLLARMIQDGLALESEEQGRLTDLHEKARLRLGWLRGWLYQESENDGDELFNDVLRKYLEAVAQWEGQAAPRRPKDPEYDAELEPDYGDISWTLSASGQFVVVDHHGAHVPLPPRSEHQLPNAWFKEVARNLLHDHRKKFARERAIIASDVEINDKLAKSMTSADGAYRRLRYVQEIERLPPVQREAFVLQYAEGLTLDEAERLLADAKEHVDRDLSPDAAKARAKLASQVADLVTG
jgi:hypothetical protein